MRLPADPLPQHHTDRHGALDVVRWHGPHPGTGATASRKRSPTSGLGQVTPRGVADNNVMVEALRSMVALLERNTLKALAALASTLGLEKVGEEPRSAPNP